MAAPIAILNHTHRRNQRPIPPFFYFGDGEAMDRAIGGLCRVSTLLECQKVPEILLLTQITLALTY
jgi:hypothetical protein